MKNWKERKVGIPSGAGPGLLPSLPSSSPGDTEMTSAAAWLAVHAEDHEKPPGPGRAMLFLSWCSDSWWLSVGTGMWIVRLSPGHLAATAVQGNSPVLLYPCRLDICGFAMQRDPTPGQHQTYLQGDQGRLGEGTWFARSGRGVNSRC